MIKWNDDGQGMEWWWNKIYEQFQPQNRKNGYHWIFYNQYGDCLQVVHLEVSDVMLDGGSDVVTLYNNDTLEELDQVIGFRVAPFPLGTFESSVFVVFSSDKSGQANGFLLSYNYTGMLLYNYFVIPRTIYFKIQWIFYKF